MKLIVNSSEFVIFRALEIMDLSGSKSEERDTFGCSFQRKRASCRLYMRMDHVDMGYLSIEKNS